MNGSSSGTKCNEKSPAAECYRLHRLRRATGPWKSKEPGRGVTGWGLAAGHASVSDYDTTPPIRTPTKKPSRDLETATAAAVSNAVFGIGTQRGPA